MLSESVSIVMMGAHASPSLLSFGKEIDLVSHLSDASSLIGVCYLC